MGMHKDDPSFLGRGWPFPPAFDPHTGQVMMVQTEEDIAQSLRILMQTRPGERVMQPAYGCRLHDLVFEPMSGETRAAIAVAIERAILHFEPRIALTHVEVADDDWIEGRLTIRLDYRIRATNTRNNIVFPFYTTEGTLVSERPVPAG
jgi:phage baseplate assembly protein W